MPAGLRKNEGTTWCGAQTRAHSFPHLRILPAPLAPLLAISLALLCVSGLICRCRHGAKRRENLLGHPIHFSCAVSGGQLGCGRTFSFLNLVAGGQLDVGAHLVVHTDRLRLHYFAGLRRLAKCMLPTLLPLYPHFYLPNSSDSRHSPLSLTCPSSHTLHMYTHLSRARLAPGSLSCRLTTQGLEIS
jgi:hypothetical protein